MPSLPKNFIGIAVIVAGIVFTALVSFQLYRVQKRSIDTDFAAQISSHARAIKREMDLNAEALYSLKGLFDGSEDVTADEFSRSASAVLARHPEILTLEWVPRVTRGARDAVEERLRQRDPHAGFTALDPAGRLIAAAERDTYFPVFYVVPLPKYARTLGFNYAAEAIRADLVARTRDGAALAMSPKVGSLMDTDATEIVLLALPIYGGPITTLAQRRDSFLGLVVAQIDLRDLVRAVVEEAERWVHSYQLVDVTAAEAPTARFRIGSEPGDGTFAHAVGEIGGRKWLMRADIDPELYLFRRAFMPLLVVVAGISLFGILALTLFQANRQRERVENEVIERTRRLDNANKKLALLSATDDLTGLENRRAAYTDLNREWQRHVRDKLKLSVMMIDIDYFKDYNDTYGHLAGDQSLKSVADVLKGSFNRPADIVARYGGEEFLAILPNTDAESELLAEQCCRAVEGMRIPHEKSRVSRYVTISIGVTTLLPDNSSDIHLLLDRADQALYAAKSAGRNRVCRAD